MNRSATIQLHRDGDTADPQTIATGTFVVDNGLASNPISTLVLRLPFSIPEAGNFVVESAVVASNGNASLSVRRITDPPETLFLAMWVWHANPDPYFGIHLPAIGTISVYLQASASSEPRRRRP